ncbi:uncharacterized protein BJ212DRAFT_1293873, partial [Suillus subaureus]
IFETVGITFSLPYQYSYQHYVLLTHLFRAPNGLCSSITGPKYIKAAKEPWMHSSWYKPLGQILITNKCLDKLAASCVDFYLAQNA